MRLQKTSFTLFISACALIAITGCRSDNTSATKDVVANGVSNSGKSRIHLEFYPIKDNKIQMQRCLSGAQNFCKTYCVSPSDLRKELKGRVSNVDTVISAINSTANKDFGDEFKALQSTLLEMADNGTAQECADQVAFHPPQGVTKQTSQVRRDTGLEIADSYTLMPNGDFFREVNGTKCQITNKVEDFKVSSHPKDAALVYFIKSGALFVVNPSPEPADGECPRTIDRAIMANVAKTSGKYDYWVTSANDTTVVNSARDSFGRFVAWDNKVPVYSSENDNRTINDVDMNQCFGVAGKSFKSYVAFLLTSRNTVIKIKGKPSDPDFSVEDRGTFFSLDEFRSKYNVCN